MYRRRLQAAGQTGFFVLQRRHAKGALEQVIEIVGALKTALVHHVHDLQVGVGQQVDRIVQPPAVPVGGRCAAEIPAETAADVLRRAPALRRQVGKPWPAQVGGIVQPFQRGGQPGRQAVRKTAAAIAGQQQAAGKTDPAAARAAGRSFLPRQAAGGSAGPAAPARRRRRLRSAGPAAAAAAPLARAAGRRPGTGSRPVPAPCRREKPGQYGYRGPAPAWCARRRGAAAAIRRGAGQTAPRPPARPALRRSPE